MYGENYTFVFLSNYDCNLYSINHSIEYSVKDGSMNLALRKEKTVNPITGKTNSTMIYEPSHDVQQESAKLIF